MIKNMDLEYLSGLMGRNMKGSGKKANKMEKVCLQQLKDNANMEK